MLESCISIVYPILLVFYLNAGNRINEDVLGKVVVSDGNILLTIESDMATAILLGILTFFPALSIYGDKLNIFQIILIILSVLSALALSNDIFLEFDQEYTRHILATIFSIYSIIIYKYYSLYEKLTETSVYIKWIMYGLSNIVMYGYCFIVSNECNVIILNRCGITLLLLLLPIPYILTKQTSNIPNDLHHFRKQMEVFVISQAINQSFCISWSFYFKYYEKQYPFLSIIFVFVYWMTAVSGICGLTVLPLILEKIQEYKFKECVKNNNIELLWWIHVFLNDSKFQNFLFWLANYKMSPNLLFVIELVGYKNCVVHKLNIAKKGYVLPLNRGQNILDGSPITSNIHQLSSNDLSFQRIKSDLSIFYLKYLQKHDKNGSINPLYANFVNRNNRKYILKSLNTMRNSEDILLVFDNAIKETATTLQSLYRVYQFEHFDP